MNILINTSKLILLATSHRWGDYCKYFLCRIFGVIDEPLRPVTTEEVARLPATVDYAVFRCADLIGEQHLFDVANAREGIDPVKDGGALMLALAQEFYLPEIPKEHPAYLETLRLLRLLSAYLEGRANAESFMQTAYLYRSQFGTDRDLLGSDPGYEDLFDAMPSGPLDDVIANGWPLAASWKDFGRFLAWKSPEFDALEQVRERIEQSVFFVGDEFAAINAEAREFAHGIVDHVMDVFESAALAEYDERLGALIDRVVGYASEESETVTHGE